MCVCVCKVQRERKRDPLDPAPGVNASLADNQTLTHPSIQLVYEDKHTHRDLTLHITKGDIVIDVFDSCTLQMAIYLSI